MIRGYQNNFWYLQYFIQNFGHMQCGNTKFSVLVVSIFRGVYRVVHHKNLGPKARRFFQKVWGVHHYGSWNMKISKNTTCAEIRTHNL